MEYTKILLILFIFILPVNTTVFSQTSIQCIIDCDNEARICLNWEWMKYMDCVWDCRQTYPVGYDHGYYSDFCEASCELRLNTNVHFCYSNLDLCLENCEGDEDDTTDGDGN